MLVEQSIGYIWQNRTEENTQRARQFHLALYMTKISPLHVERCCVCPILGNNLTVRRQTKQKNKEDVDEEEAANEEEEEEGVDMEASVAGKNYRYGGFLALALGHQMQPDQTETAL